MYNVKMPVTPHFMTELEENSPISVPENEMQNSVVHITNIPIM